MIVGAGLPSPGFVLIVLAVQFSIPIIIVFGTFFTTRPGKSLVLATTIEAAIRSLTAKLILWGIFNVTASVEQTLAGFGTSLPTLTALTLDFARLIREATGSPLSFGFLLFFCATAVAIDTAIFNQLGKHDLRRARRFSVTVSIITLSVLGLMTLQLALSYIKLLNHLDYLV